MNLTEMKTKPINELVDIAESLGIEDVGRIKKQEIIFRIFKRQAKEGRKKEVYVEKSLDISKPITLDFLTNPDKK